MRINMRLALLLSFVFVSLVPLGAAERGYAEEREFTTSSSVEVLSGLLYENGQYVYVEVNASWSGKEHRTPDTLTLYLWICRSFGYGPGNTEEWLVNSIAIPTGSLVVTGKKRTIEIDLKAIEAITIEHQRFGLRETFSDASMLPGFRVSFSWIIRNPSVVLDRRELSGTYRAGCEWSRVERVEVSGSVVGSGEILGFRSDDFSVIRPTFWFGTHTVNKSSAFVPEPIVEFPRDPSMPLEP